MVAGKASHLGCCALDRLQSAPAQTDPTCARGVPVAPAATGSPLGVPSCPVGHWRPALRAEGGAALRLAKEKELRRQTRVMSVSRQMSRPRCLDVPLLCSPLATITMSNHPVLYISIATLIHSHTCTPPPRPISRTFQSSHLKLHAL